MQNQNVLHKQKRNSTEVICGNCKELFKMSTSKYKIRLRQSKSGLLFCSTGCNGSFRKRVHFPIPEVTSMDELEAWFGPNTRHKLDPDKVISSTLRNIIREKQRVSSGVEPDEDSNPSETPAIFSGGVNMTPGKNNTGGYENFKSNLKGDHPMNMAELLAQNPEYIDLSPEEIVVAEAKKLVEVETVRPATPIVTQPVQPRVVNNPVINQSSGLVTPMVREQIISRWQDSLNNKENVGQCDADYWDEGCTLKKCNFNATERLYRYSFVDDATGELTFSGRPCYRCQGKGYLTEQNVGYNFDSDKKRNIIPQSMVWQEYRSIHILA